MASICLITFRPSKIWCEFLNKFVHYKPFVIVDDSSFDLSEFVDLYKNITFIHIDSGLCEMNGYKDATKVTLNKSVTGWDKALYYFAFEDRNYDNVWFLEDDVFFYNENTIKQIDDQYRDIDLLSNTITENKDGTQKDWLWHRIDNVNYTFPYYSGMMCICRMSKSLLTCIDKYTKNYKTFFFLEAAFPTVAFKNNLKVRNPQEFLNVKWIYDVGTITITEYNLYHPMKKLNNHEFFRTHPLPTIYIE